jgi:hypothetical protein
MKFKILQGRPAAVEKDLNELQGKVEIKSVESKFGKYGVDEMCIVVSITDVPYQYL